MYDRIRAGAAEKWGQGKKTPGGFWKYFHLFYYSFISSFIGPLFPLYFFRFSLYPRHLQNPLQKLCSIFIVFIVFIGFFLGGGGKDLSPEPRFRLKGEDSADIFFIGKQRTVRPVPSLPIPSQSHPIRSPPAVFLSPAARVC